MFVELFVVSVDFVYKTGTSHEDLRKTDAPGLRDSLPAAIKGLNSLGARGSGISHVPREFSSHPCSEISPLALVMYAATYPATTFFQFYDHVRISIECIATAY